MTDVVVPGVPFPLEASGNPACQVTVSGGSLTLVSGAKSDLFMDPAGEEAARPDAGRLTGLPGDVDFTLSARVTVGFGSVFDAGVLLLYLSERRWAKLCYELSPQRRPTAVTVVTHTRPDLVIRSQSGAPAPGSASSPSRPPAPAAPPSSTRSPTSQGPPPTCATAASRSPGRSPPAVDAVATAARRGTRRTG